MNVRTSWIILKEVCFMTTKLNREYKSWMFIMIFGDKEKLLELYNAVSGKNYKDPEMLTINTLENAIYLSMKNDVSFLIDFRLSLYEHQSTYNPNMPLRFLLYLADVYSDLSKDENLYGRKRIPLPVPKCIVFYNGQEDRPDYEELRLSDSYMVHEEGAALELRVDVLNINVGHNKKLLESCQTLQDYAQYVHRVRMKAKQMPIEAAVEQTIEECIRENILRDFLMKNKAEAKKVSIYEYNEEEHLRMEREEAFEEGVMKERENTQRERERADKAEENVRQMEAELKRLKEELKKIQKKQ